MLHNSSHLISHKLANNAKIELQVAKSNSEVFISAITKISWIILGIVIIYQAVFFASLPNFIAIGCAILAWLFFTNFFLKSNVFYHYPLSTFVLLGFTSTQLYFPLLFTSLEGKPVIYNLELPYQVFLHTILAFTVLVIAHFIYRSVHQRYASETPNLLIKLGFFDAPTELQLWLMGAVGLAATAYVWLYSPSIGWEVTGDTSGKIVQSLTPFSYAPLLIPFGRLYGSRQPVTIRVIVFLLLHILLLFAVSIGRNSRGGFMIGFTSIGFAYMLGLLLGAYKAQFFTIKNVILGIGAYWLFTGPIADIGTAMVLVRGQRLNISYSELMSNTLTAFQDKEAIRAYRLANSGEDTSKNGWNESYLDNIFLARFCNIKFNDLSLVKAKLIGYQNPKMFQYNIDYFWSELPQPVLNAIGLSNVDKVALKGGSLGDYLYFLADGPPEVVTWFSTGHFAGIGMAAFGWWYLLILGVGIISIYWLFDKLFVVGLVPTHSGQLSFQFSLCGLLVLDSIFRFLPFESVIVIGNFLIRGWLQLLLLYFVLYHFTRFVSLMIPAAGKPKKYRFITN